MPNLIDLKQRFDVGPLLQQLEGHPELWNEFPHRTADENSPHHGIDDIWFRYADPNLPFTTGPHESVWYPSAAKVPAVMDLCEKVMEAFGVSRLGGVLLTRIPPGRMVKPHKDEGWHAREYDKVAVQVKGNDRQAFHFVGEHLSAQPGDAYWFDNSFIHWVTNDSDEDRMTLIVCVKGD